MAVSFGKFHICSACRKEKKEVERELMRRAFAARFPELDQGSVFASDIRLKTCVALRGNYTLDPAIFEKILSDSRFWIKHRTKTPEEILKLIYESYPDECASIVENNETLKLRLAKGIFFCRDKHYGKSLAERCFNMRIQHQYPFLRRYPKAMRERVVRCARENLPSPRELLWESAQCTCSLSRMLHSIAGKILDWALTLAEAQETINDGTPNPS
jgi:hypothetical protein